MYDVCDIGSFDILTMKKNIETYKESFKLFTSNLSMMGHIQSIWSITATQWNR